VNGGQCLVAWQKICKPLSMGGLGVKDLPLQGIALQMRWDWLRHTDPLRPWQGLPLIEDLKTSKAFNSMVQISVGDGARTLFWRDRWIKGVSVQDIAPICFSKVSDKCASKRIVQEALQNNRWIGDIRGRLGTEGVIQCLILLTSVSTLVRDTSIPDRFHWPWTKSRIYTARSAYRAMCFGAESMEGASAVWKSWAPLRCKIFAWLALQCRLLTTEQRHRHGLQDQVSACFTCLQEPGELNHILMDCVYAR
jgi:hypothetical protein